VRRALLALALVLGVVLPSCAQTAQLPSDWKKAIWRSPLHIAGSIPVAAATIAIPPIGKKYIRWRTREEAHHVITGQDTPGKSEMDLYSQTALVRRVLRLYKIKK
jgi:hypothetical protein